MTKRKVRIILISLFGIALVALGIFMYRAIINRSLEKKRHEVIRTVVTQLLTGPNQELITLYDEMFEQTRLKSDQNQQGESSQDSRIYSPDSSKLQNKIRNLYQPYFTDGSYEKFESKFLIEFYIFSTTSGHQLIVKDLDIKQSETNPTNYSFTAKVQHGKEGSEMEDIEVTGSVQMDHEENKLTYIQFINHDLYRELR